MKDAQLGDVGDWTDCGFAGDIDNYQLRMTATTTQETTDKRQETRDTRQEALDNKHWQH